MKLTPRLSGSYTAIKLTQDLIIPAGDYLIIGDDESVSQLSERDVQTLFKVAPNERSVPKVKITRTPCTKISTRKGVTICHQIVLAFGPDNSGNYLERLSRKKIADILGFNDALIRIGPRLSELYTAELIQRHGATNKEWTYSLTDEGKALSEKLRGRRLL